MPPRTAPTLSEIKDPPHTGWAILILALCAVVAMYVLGGCTKHYHETHWHLAPIDELPRIPTPQAEYGQGSDWT